MPIALVTGPANSGKAQVVLDALRVQLARGRDPLLIVPTDADQARYRRELAQDGLVLGVRVERFHGLLSEVLRRSGVTEAVLGKLARERLLASLASGWPGVQEDGARGGLVGALGELVSELEVARVSPARLRDALTACGDASRDAGGEAGAELTWMQRVCDLFDAYLRALKQMKRSDAELRCTRALDELRRKPSLWGSTPVLLYGFDSFTEIELDAIETLGGPVDAEVTVSLAYEPARRAFAGRASAFHRMKRLAGLHTELPPRAEHYARNSRAPLHHLERSLFEERPPHAPPGCAVRLLEGATPRAELELVAAEVRALLDDGVAPQDVAIVHRSPQLVGELLGEVLDDFQVPHSLRVRTHFARTAIGAGLLGLMRCAFGEGTLGDLLAWLRTPGVLAIPELADRLEASARQCGALSAAQARQLWESQRWPLDRIDRLRSAAGDGLEALVDALGAELERLFLSPRRGVGTPLERDEQIEARALRAGRRALGELRELGRLAPAHSPSPRDLIEALQRIELSERSTLTSDGVAVLDPLSLRARRVRALFVCGMQEGLFPAPPPTQPLLGAQERRALALASGLLLGGEPAGQLDRERYLLYALCSRPQERLVLSWHIATEDGAPVARSLFVDDVCDLFDESLSVQTERMAPISPDESSAQIVVRRMVDRPIAPLSDDRVLAELRGRTLWSASSLECLNACPVRWFVERVLRPQGLDPDPEPLAGGALAHAALRQTLERLREQTASARLTPSNLPQATSLLREALDEHAAHHPLSVAAERASAARRRLQSDLERYLGWAAERGDELEPSYFELEFGFAEQDDSTRHDGSAKRDDSTRQDRAAGEGEASLPALDLGDGVSVRGRIDRVDLSPQGEAVVYDYKARSAIPAAKWVSDGVLQVGLYMRAAERLLHRPVAGGFYQPLRGKDLRPRGALDGESGVELDCLRTDRRERAELEELLSECEQAAVGAVQRVRTGALEGHPQTCSHQGGCLYPSICRQGGLSGV